MLLKYSSGIFFVLIIFCLSCAPTKYLYEVNSTDGIIIIDGLANESLWDDGKLLTDFKYPWQEFPAPTTTFKALHDNEFLYFYYYADDDDIRLKQSGDEETDAVASDRVEFFIRASDPEKPYYSFEMDPQGRVFDSKGEFGEYIDREYDFPRSHFEINGKVNSDNYTLEGKISITKLREMGLVENGEIVMGLYRGEYFLDDTGAEKTYWISWVVPDSEKPNFHIPSSFGKLKLK